MRPRSASSCRCRSRFVGAVYAVSLGTAPDRGGVIDILAGQLGCDDLSSVGIHPDMELSPGPRRPCSVLLDQPLTGTAYVDGPRLARAVQLRRSGRLRSYVRPLLCGRLTAGPDGLRGSGSKQSSDV